MAGRCGILVMMVWIVAVSNQHVEFVTRFMIENGYK